jgi:hypothetical protein
MLTGLLQAFEAVDHEQKKLQKIFDNMGLHEMMVTDDAGEASDHEDSHDGDAMSNELGGQGSELGGQEAVVETPAAIHRFFHELFIARQRPEFEGAEYKQALSLLSANLAQAQTAFAENSANPTAAQQARFADFVEEYAALVQKYLPPTVAEDIIAADSAPDSVGAGTIAGTKGSSASSGSGSDGDGAGAGAGAEAGASKAGTESETEQFFDAETGEMGEAAPVLTSMASPTAIWAFLSEIVLTNM